MSAFRVTQALRASQRANVTGFNPQKLAAASGQPKNDPWARNEAWRYSGPFTAWNRFKGAFPGFGWALGAFAIYLGYEQVFLQDSHHAEGHGEGHH